MREVWRINTSKSRVQIKADTASVSVLSSLALCSPNPPSLAAIWMKDCSFVLRFKRMKAFKRSLARPGEAQI